MTPDEKREYEKFKNALLQILKDVAPERSQTDYEEDENPKRISFTWFHSEEEKVDRFIRVVRNRLLKYPRFIENDTNSKFTFEIWKTHIQSHNYWNLEFWLAEKYMLTENSQP